MFGTIVSTFVTFLSPAQRWQQLRGAALAIESEVWKFRTRTGPYLKSADSALAQEEESLLDFLEQMKQHVYKSASVMDTAFYSQVEAVSMNPGQFSISLFGELTIVLDRKSPEISPWSIREYRDGWELWCCKARVPTSPSLELAAVSNGPR